VSANALCDYSGSLIKAGRKSNVISLEMQIDSYAYLPPRFQHSLKCYASATLVVFERRYVPICVIIDWIVCHLVQMFHLHGMLGMRIHSKYPYMALMLLKNLFYQLKLLCY
jgi:hypothetical protein